MKSNLFILFLVLVLTFKLSKAENTDTIQNYLNEVIDKITVLSNSKPDSVMMMIKKALPVAVLNNANKEKAELLRIKGLVYYYKVDYAKALDFFIQSRDINKQIGNKKGEALSLGNIALVYGDQGLMQKTLEMQLQVLNMYKQLGDSSYIARGYNNLAVSYRDVGQYKKALNLYKKAASILISIKEKDGLNLYLNNIGQIYIYLNNYDSALYYFNKSLLISKQLNEKQFISNSLAYIGQCCMLKNDYQKAIEYLELSLVNAKETGIVYEIEDVSEFLHKAYAKTGNFTDAYKMLLLSKTMADSANNIKAMRKLTEIEISLVYEKELELQKLEQEKKELQNKLTLHTQKQIKYIAFIVLLASLIWMFFLYRSYRRMRTMNYELIAQKKEITAQKEEIETQRDEIEEMNKTKDKFFAIIAHDLRNPINGIYRLSEIMEQRYEFMEVKKLKEYISQIYLSTKKTYELLENLLSWAMIQNGAIEINKTSVNITEIIKDNIELLSENLKLKKITASFPENRECLVIADKKMTDTVIRNLLHNAIKFTPSGGFINFNLMQKEKFCEISITDSGIGIDKKDLQVLFDTGHNSKEIGTSAEKGTGLGLMLCKEFIDINKGSIWVESEIAKGTTFYFTLPLA